MMRLVIESVPTVLASIPQMLVPSAGALNVGRVGVAINARTTQTILMAPTNNKKARLDEKKLFSKKGTGGGKNSNKESSKAKGGAYKDVPANGGEVHHMPANSVSPYSRGKGPSVRMDKKDHRRTASCGNSKDAQQYRAKQKELIEKGKFKEAQQMDIDDIKDNFGKKYDKGIKEMKEYTNKLLESIGGKGS